MGWKSAVVVLIVAIVVGFFIVRTLNPPLITEPPPAGDGWWGRGLREVSEPKQDKSVRKFRVNVSNETLEDLKFRLQNTRFIDRLEDSQFHYGFNSDYMKVVTRYWIEKYSWRKTENILNSFDQFVTNIEGIDVHFLHVKPKLVAGQKAKPLLLVHGWPGSVYEFYKILPMLTDPTNHGGSPDDAFEVICPSLPGYGFSEAPHKQGFKASEAARVLHKLMHRLGFKEYYIQGGDFGAIVNLNIAIMFPSEIKGFHTSFGPQISAKTLLYPFIAQLWPSVLMPNVHEQEKLLPAGEKLWSFVKLMIAETGYSHLQATKPDTIAQGVNDSPVGLAAYILEKFSSGTDINNRNLPDGGLTKVWTLDDLLSNVMIYWVNENMASAMRWYKEDLSRMLENYMVTHANMVPMGFAVFPNEVPLAPEYALRHFNPNLISYNIMPRGGHFAAFQEPRLLADDFRQFVRKVEAL